MACLSPKTVTSSWARSLMRVALASRSRDHRFYPISTGRIIIVCDAMLVTTWVTGRDTRSRLRPLGRQHSPKAYTASSAAPSQSTASHRLASPSSRLDSATHRMLSCSCSGARVDVCVCVCGRATADVMALALARRTDRQRAHIGSGVTGNWDWR